MLDTNVVSELTRPAPNPNVSAWMRACDEDRLYLSVLTFAEINHGIARLAPGPRRERLRRWMEVDLADRFQGRILDVNRTIAETWGVIMARAAAAGARLPSLDTLLAATAEHHAMTIVSRNEKDFVHVSVAVVNPWKESGAPAP